MLRRLLIPITVIAAMLLDTSVIPVFYHGVYTVPLTFVIVLCISLLLGRMNGLLYGMIGGLLIDTSVGTTPTMTFFFMICGFLMALIIDEKQSDVSGILKHLRRGLVAFILFFLGEVFFALYEYFNTAYFSWFKLGGMVLRSLLTALLTMGFCPLLRRLFIGKHAHAGNDREVNNY